MDMQSLSSLKICLFKETKRNKEIRLFQSLLIVIHYPLTIFTSKILQPDWLNSGWGGGNN